MLRPNRHFFYIRACMYARNIYIYIYIYIYRFVCFCVSQEVCDVCRKSVYLYVMETYNLRHHNDDIWWLIKVFDIYMYIYIYVYEYYLYVYIYVYIYTRIYIHIWLFRCIYKHKITLSSPLWWHLTTHHIFDHTLEYITYVMYNVYIYTYIYIYITV
jgi:hypothetical protein